MFVLEWVLCYHNKIFWRQSGQLWGIVKKTDSTPVAICTVLSSERGRCHARVKMAAMDSTKAYSHWWDIFVSGSRCPAITTKLVDDVKAGVRYKHLWNTNTLWGLVVLEQGCYDAWEGEG